MYFVIDTCLAGALDVFGAFSSSSYCVYSLCALLNEEKEKKEETKTFGYLAMLYTTMFCTVPCRCRLNANFEASQSITK